MSLRVQRGSPQFREEIAHLHSQRASGQVCVWRKCHLCGVRNDRVTRGLSVVYLFVRHRQNTIAGRRDV